MTPTYATAYNYPRPDKLPRSGAKLDPGRPRIIPTPEEFDRLVDEYRAQCEQDDEPITFTGMALHLGFASRQSFYDYGKLDGFSYPVRKARALVEREYEKRLAGNNVAGAIFALKNHGWSDKQELEHSGPEGGGIPITTIVRKVIDPASGG